MKNIDLIQEEAKRRFPIGCYYISANGSNSIVRKLKDDSSTYNKCGSDTIWAHNGGGCLCYKHIWAKLCDKNGNEIPFNEDICEPNYEVY